MTKLKTQGPQRESSIARLENNYFIIQYKNVNTKNI